jgi:ribonuclease PH
MARHANRAAQSLRTVEVEVGFHRLGEGSCLYRAEGTVVLCVASIDESVPPHLIGKNRGWVTAEYQMHPRISPQRREARDGRGKAPSGRTQEIQRLVARALRAAVDLEKLGPRTITVDCDVFEADGGTRTASITGGFIALALALRKLPGVLALRDQVAAVSVGHVGDEILLDLDYREDSQARVDLNLVGTARGGVVEVQGTAEGEAVPRADLDRLIDLGQQGVADLGALQRRVLAAAGVSLASLGLVGA